MRTEQTIKGINFVRIDNDVNDNQRYVCHFLSLTSPQDEERAQHLSKTAQPYQFHTSHLYDIAVKKANKLGGRRYHTKSYGGGVVFQSYNIADLADSINRAKSL